ncbi:MAG: serine/threonine protein kinase/Flp pilus assembly protein TadD [Planctomycetota bacterium]|jgi:serine/threonine protein kinase/Flp pilus assembly protein TadD
MNTRTTTGALEAMRFAHFSFDPAEDRLGEGPQCEVFRAVDSRLDRTVALKILRPHVEFDPSAVERFEREARHTSSLQHPNIATVFEYGQEKGTSFIAMEFLEGRTLDKIVVDRVLTFAEGIRVGLQVTSALDLVHRHGLIHRDLKPGNVMLQVDGEVKLLDFGICRSKEEPTLTEDGMLVGTVLYMSPEQVQGGDLKPSSDIFALGSVLFHAITGQLAFPGKSFPEVCMSIMACKPNAPSTARDGFPPLLEEFILKCLSPEPLDRYQDAAAAHGALLTIADSIQLENRGPQVKTTIRGGMLMPPIQTNSEDEHTNLIARSIRNDLESDLERSTALELELLEDSKLPKGSIGSYVLRSSLTIDGHRGSVQFEVGRIGAGNRISPIFADEFELEDEDEWGLQAQLVGSMARSIRHSLSKCSLEPGNKKPRDPETARKLAHQAHATLHCGTSRKLMAAVSTFRRSLEADSTNALALAGMAEALVFKFLYFDGDRTFIEESREFARRALTIDTQCAEAHTSLGFAHHMTGHDEDAMREYRLAIQMDNNEFMSHRLLGALLAREGNYKAASPLLRRAIALRPTHIGSYDHLYCVLRHLDRYEEALEVADQGIAVARDRLQRVESDQEARTHSAMLLARLGMLREARGEVKRAVDLTPKDGYTLYHCGCALAICGDAESALPLIKSAMLRGYYLRSELVRNTDLDNLRGMAGFQALIG